VGLVEQHEKRSLYSGTDADRPAARSRTLTTRSRVLLEKLQILLVKTFPTFRSSEWPHPFRFSNENTLRISHLSRVCYVSHPSHPPWFDQILHTND